MYRAPDNCQIFELGDVPLQRGGVLKNAKLAYQTWGKLNAGRDNCIVFPTYYTGNHESNARMIGPGRALDPEKWFIVVPNQFGNGLSSSPSNAEDENQGARFPHVTVLDNVRCQHRLVRDHLNAARVALATGWSLGAVQAYQWAVSFPDYVEALLPFCGTARCSPHNYVFLEGVKAALTADQTFNGGNYASPPVAGLRAFGRVYAGWAYSQTFFRDQLYRRLGFDLLEAFLKWWEDDHTAWDANDLLCMLWTWQHANPADNEVFQGDWESALQSIRAKTIVMPCTHDLYFTLEDNRLECERVAGASFEPIDSPFGHCALAPGRFAECMRVLEDALTRLLKQSL